MPRGYRSLWWALCAAGLACGCAEQTPEPQAPVVVSTEGPVAKPKPESKSKSKQPGSEAAADASSEKVRRLVAEIELKKVDALPGDRATSADVLSSNDESAAALLDAAARSSSGASGGGALGLRGGAGAAPGSGGALTAVSGPVVSGSTVHRGGNVSGSQPSVLGAVDKRAIRKVIRRHRRRIRRCYERELMRNPNVGGKLVVRFVIVKNGTVSNAAVGSTNTNSSTLDSCVLRVVRGMRFPKPKGGGIAMVRYPFIFTAAP